MTGVDTVAPSKAAMKKPEDATDTLFELEQKIARRADELTREQGGDFAHALNNWRQAEREVWENYVDTHDLHHATPTPCHV